MRNPLEVWGLKPSPVIQKLPSVAKATFPTLGTGNILQHLTFPQGQREEEKDIGWASELKSAVNWTHPWHPYGHFRRAATPKKLFGASGMELNGANVNKKRFMVQGGL